VRRDHQWDSCSINLLMPSVLCFEHCKICFRSIVTFIYVFLMPFTKWTFLTLMECSYEFSEGGWGVSW
jgi:hypothetical protein